MPGVKSFAKVFVTKSDGADGKQDGENDRKFSKDLHCTNRPGRERVDIKPCKANLVCKERLV